MALAVLRFDGRDRRGSRFRFDIGKNRYYRFAVGAGTARRPSGLAVLESPRFQSELLGPLPERDRGRGVLTVPAEAFDRDHRTVQLLSFRTRDLISPAVSDPVRVPAGSVGDGVPEAPALHFSRGAAMPDATTPTRAVEMVPFRYREGRYSHGMFLGALAGMLPTLLPKVAPLVGKLLGGFVGGGSSGGNGGGAVEAISRTVGDPQIVDLLSQLLRQVQQTASMPAPAAPAATAPAAPAAAAFGSARRCRRSKSLGRRRSPRPAYAEAQVAPALLAALPALMPLLKNVLSPQTIQGVINQPNKLTQTAISGLQELGKLGITSHEQDLRHLRAIHPGIDDPALEALLQSMSLALSRPAKELDYRRVSSVELDFEDVREQPLYGSTRTLYAHGADLGFPLAVRTPRPIRGAVVELSIKDAESLELLARRRQRIETAASGRLASVPTVPAARLQALEPGRDYLVCAALVWKNRRGSRRGTSRQQRITVVGEYAFDRVEESSELLPLADAGRYREFWHKLWQGTFADGVKRFEIACKYYYVLDPKRAENARIETRLRLEDGDRRRSGQLESGMELSLTALNRLLPQLAPGQQPLSQSELAALRSPDFVARFNQAVRYNAKLRGRAGDSAALWLFPEMKLQTVVLQRAAAVDPTGHVTALEEHRVTVPMPAVAHFIGARTE